jgi:hypothetical protein
MNSVYLAEFSMGENRTIASLLRENNEIYHMSTKYLNYAVFL